MPGANLGTALLGLVSGGAQGWAQGLEKRHAEKRQDQQLETQRALEDWNALTPESQVELTKQGISWRDPQYWKKKGDVASTMAQGKPAQAIAGDSPIQPNAGNAAFNQMPKLGGAAPATTGITAPGPASATPMVNPGTPAEPGKYLETYDSAKLKLDQSKLVEQANNFAMKADDANRHATDVEHNSDLKEELGKMGFQVQYDKLNAAITDKTNEYNLNLAKLNETHTKDEHANTALLMKVAQQGKEIDSLIKTRKKVTDIAQQRVNIAKQNADSGAIRAGASVTNAGANKERADKYKTGGGSSSRGGGGKTTGVNPLTLTQAYTVWNKAHSTTGGSDSKNSARNELKAGGWQDGKDGPTKAGSKSGGTVAPVNPYKTPGAKVVNDRPSKQQVTKEADKRHLKGEARRAFFKVYDY